MNKHLIEKGFVSILGDPCLFRKVLPNGKIILAATYVDDITFAVSNVETRDLFMVELRERFEIKEDEGKPIDWLLGMLIKQDLKAGTININMELMITKLAQGILTDEELLRSKNVRHPMLLTPLLKQTERTVSKETFDYLSVVGSLLHISNSVRCDIALAVGHLSRPSNAPGPQHIKAIKRVIMYLYNTRSLGITYTRPLKGSQSKAEIYEGAKHPLDDGINQLQTFADSDYAGDETKRSTMGMVIMLNGGPIAWSSTLAKTVALSTCEAEINAACMAAKEAIHFSRLLFDLGATTSIIPLQIAEDNSACIAQANSGIKHVRNAKHYAIRLRFLQQLVVDKQIEFVYCPTEVQLADFFTKPLEEDKFVFFRNSILGLQSQTEF